MLDLPVDDDREFSAIIAKLGLPGVWPAGVPRLRVQMRGYRFLRIDSNAPGGPQIQARVVKAFFRLCGESAFNINGPKPVTWDFENEVGFGSGSPL